MLKRCVLLLGLRQSNTRESRKKALMGITASFDVSLQFPDTSLCSQVRDICVRVVHAGGREELYHHTLYASELMKKYPGTRVARPEVFRSPHESLLEGGEKLHVGFKYFIIPSTTAEKLKRRHQESMKSGWNGDRGSSGDSNRSSRERSVKSSGKRTGTRKKAFVPPIRTKKEVRALPWEPELHSVAEISP